MTHADLKDALRTFGFTEHDQITMALFKKRHRDLTRNSHPDAGGEASGHAIQQINAAAALLTEYLASYRFSFTEDEFYRQNPEERIRMQFANDPVWGAS